MERIPVSIDTGAQVRVLERGRGNQVDGMPEQFERWAAFGWFVGWLVSWAVLFVSLLRLLAAPRVVGPRGFFDSAGRLQSAPRQLDHQLAQTGVLRMGQTSEQPVIAFGNINRGAHEPRRVKPNRILMYTHHDINMR